MKRPKRAPAYFLAALMALAVGMVAVPGGFANHGAAAQHYFIKFLSSKCKVPADGWVQVVVKEQMGTFPGPRNNLRSMSVQARLLPADRGAGFQWSHAWGKKVTDSLVSPDGNNNTTFLLQTPQERMDDYDLQIKAKWDRKFTKDWNVKAVGPFNEGFCQSGGGFRPVRLTATSTPGT